MGQRLSSFKPVHALRISDIPPEILIEIFKHVLEQDLPPEDPSEDWYPQDYHTNLTTLRLVSKDWHDAALSAPSLWSRVYVNMYDGQRVTYNRAMRWFNRSGTWSAKSLWVQATAHNHSRTEEGEKERCELEDEQLVKILVEGPALEQLTIDCVSPWCFAKLLRCMACTPSQNQKIWGSIKAFKLVIREQWDLEAFSLAMREVRDHTTGLSSFKLYLPHRNAVFADVDDEWSMLIDVPAEVLTRLTHLSLGCDWGYTRILDLLSSCSELHWLTLQLFSAVRETHDPPLAEQQQVDLPALQTLQVKNAPASAVPFLLLLHTPSLVDLDIRFDLDTKDETLKEFSQYITSISRNSTSGLRKLRIHSAITECEEFAEILCNLPFLTHLTVDSRFYDGPSSLAGLKMRNPPPLQHLEQMKLLNLPLQFNISDAVEYITRLNTTRRSQELDLAHNIALPEARLPTNLNQRTNRRAQLETTFVKNLWPQHRPWLVIGDVPISLYVAYYINEVDCSMAAQHWSIYVILGISGLVLCFRTFDSDLFLANWQIQSLDWPQLGMIKDDAQRVLAILWHIFCLFMVIVLVYPRR